MSAPGQPLAASDVFAISTASGSGFLEFAHYSGTTLVIDRAFEPFSGYSGDVSIAQTGSSQVAIAAGPGASSQVKIFDMKTGALLQSFAPFAASFTGGADLAWSDARHLAIGAGAGGGTRVQIFDTVAGTATASFLAFDGQTGAATDVAWTDGTHLAVALGQGASPRVRIFDTSSGTPVASADFFAFDVTFQGGVHLAGNGAGLLAVGTASGSDLVQVFNASGTLVTSIRAFNGASVGVDVAWIDSHHLAVNALTSGSQVKIFDLTSGGPVVEESFNAHPAGRDGSHISTVGQAAASGSAPTVAISSASGAQNVVDRVVSGTVSSTGQGTTVELREGSTSLGFAKLDGNGRWTATVILPSDGAHTIAAVATDSFGAAISGAITLALDSTPNKPLFGSVIRDVSANGGAIYALYDAILDRQPDGLGFAEFGRDVKAGVSLRSIAQSMVNSPEGRSHLSATDNAACVEQLYQTALHRRSDSGGLKSGTDFLNNGGSRGDLALSFALSSENQNGMKAAFDAGVFVPDSTASDVARLYQGILNRAPDSGGLQAFTNAARSGTALRDIAQGMLGSPEFGGRAQSSNTDFVESVYQQALGRPSDPGGLQNFVTALQRGSSRADVAVAISESQEARVHLVGVIEEGFHLS